MASERISKLQKWILETCFKITVLHDREGLKPLDVCSYYKADKCPKLAEKERNSNNVIINICKFEGKSVHNGICKMYSMYIEDVLLNFFDMDFSYRRDTFDRIARIKMDENTNKNYATTSRTLKNMEEKGLVYRWKYDSYSTEIHLTEKGKEKAMILLNVSIEDINEPALLSDDECERQRKELENQIKRIETSFSYR